jgi:hypothetical protein
LVRIKSGTLFQSATFAGPQSKKDSAAILRCVDAPAYVRM